MSSNFMAEWRHVLLQSKAFDSGDIAGSDARRIRGWPALGCRFQLLPFVAQGTAATLEDRNNLLLSRPECFDAPCISHAHDQPGRAIGKRLEQRVDRSGKHHERGKPE